MEHLEKSTTRDRLNSVYSPETLEPFEQTLLLALSQLEKTELPVNTAPAHIDAAEMCSFADTSSLA